MRVIQFAGWSKTGKTSLIEKVLRVVPQEMTAGVGLSSASSTIP